MNTPLNRRYAPSAGLPFRRYLLLGAMAVLAGAVMDCARAQTYEVTTTAASGAGWLVDALNTSGGGAGKGGAVFVKAGANVTIVMDSYLGAYGAERRRGARGR